MYLSRPARMRNVKPWGWTKKGKHPMTEADLKARLVAELREDLKGAVIFRHEDKMTHGIPDISVSWRGRTTWWEVKLVADEELHTSGVQELTLLRLSAAGYARYIVFTKAKDIRRVGIVEPRNLTDMAGIWNHGWDFKWVLDQIRRVYGC